jgi:hypothetical protein
VARETTNSRHRGLHLLRHICRKTSAVHSSSITTPSVPVRTRSVAPIHQSNSGAGGTAFRVARHTEGLPHLGTSLPNLPTIRSFPPHSYSSWRLYAASSPFPSRLHKPSGALFKFSWLNTLPQCSSALHALTRSHPHPRQHSRHRGTRPLHRLDIPFQLNGGHHHRPGT